MKKSIPSGWPDRKSWAPAKSNRAFSLIELLVVLAVLVVLAATLLPAMAGTKRNSKRVQCLANLRQIGVGCSVYANDFNGWYPIEAVGAVNNYPTKVNYMGGIHYTRYIYTTSGAPDGTVMPRSYALGGTSAPYQGFDQNLGYLYGGGMIPDGHAFFCPAYSDMTTNSPIYSLSADYYSTPQFMSTHINGCIRSSYMFNPRMKTPTTGAQRAYQKVTDVKRLDVFTIDYLACPGSLPQGVPFTPDNWAHWSFQGLQAGFTDGSAKFCAITNSAFFNSIVNSLISDESQTSAAQYNAVFNALQNAP